MSLHETERFPAFRSDIRASGLAEVWTHTHDELKFTQFGWRSTTKESSYGTNTLIGNWNEERYDMHRDAATLKPLPSQYAHYFDTTCKSDYKNNNKVTEESMKQLRVLKTAGKESRAYPGHQPELDHEEDKAQYNSFMTTSRVGYVRPDKRRQPSRM
ncbi:cilia- and flagella-associated protein 68-like [Styela clava]